MSLGFKPLTFPDGATKDIWIYQSQLDHAVVYFTGATGPEGFGIGWEILSMHKSLAAAQKAAKEETDRQTRIIKEQIEEGWYDPTLWPAHTYEVIKF